MRTLFWHCRDYSRDLRLYASAGLFYSLKEKGLSSSPVQPIFIFDTEIFKKLKDPNDARVTFSHDRLQEMMDEYRKHGSDLWMFHGTSLQVFQSLIHKHKIEAVSCDHDYEPGRIRRDKKGVNLCKQNAVEFRSFKDQVIFEKDEIQTNAGNPSTVYTPYKNKWLKGLSPFDLQEARDRALRAFAKALKGKQK